MRFSRTLQVVLAVALLLETGAGRVWPSPGVERNIFTGEKAADIAGVELRGEAVLIHLNAPAAPVVFSPGQLAASPLVLDRNQRLVTSADSTHVGRVTYQVVDGREQARFERLREGMPVWSVTTEGFADFAISDDGSTVIETLRSIHLREGGRLRIYGPDGKVLGVRPQPGIRKVEVSRDGARIALNAREGILLLNRDAEMVRPLGPAVDFSLAEDGSRLALFQEGAVIVSSEDGTTFALPTEGLARKAAFSGDGAYLALVDPKNFYWVKAGTGQVLSRVAASGGAEYQDVDVNRDGTRTVVSQLKILQLRSRTSLGRARAEVSVRDRQGTLLQTFERNLSSWKGGPPDVDFLRQTSKVLIDLDTSFYILEP